MCRVTRNLLAKSPFFRGLPKHIIARLAAIAAQREFRAGQRIFSQGDSSDSFYCVVSGRVRIDAVSPLGQEISLNYAGSGDCFGEIAVVDASPRTAGACAIESTTLIAIGGRDFRRLLGEEPQLQNRVLHLLCERIRWATNRYEDSAFLDSQARLAKYVLALAKHQGLQSGVGVAIQVAQSELACYLGMSRKSVNQQLHRWKEQGWIEVGRARLLVRKPSALKRLMAERHDGTESVD